LFGRDGELDRLLRLVDPAAQPRTGSRHVVLSGEAGIGKSRLLATLMENLADHGWQVAVGQCMDLGDSPLSYLPFVDVFGRLASTEESRELLDQRPGLRPLIDQAADDTTQPLGRSALFEAVRATLNDLATTRPLLVVIEDVHWADRSSLELISFLLARPFLTPVSMIISYRTDDLHRRHPLRPVAAGWLQLPSVERIELGPLADDAIGELAGSLGAELSDEGLRRVIDRVEGNAFFAEELIAAGSMPHGIPDDLADLLILRVDRLQPSARQVVRSAAVAGRRVSHDLVQAVTGLDPVELDGALRDAVERHVLVSGGPDHYAFRHALLAEAIYQDLLPGERVRLHGAYVQALRDRPRTAAAELARHAIAAHDHHTAMTAGVQAADEAMIMGGPDEALRHYASVIELITDPLVDTSELDAVEIVTRAARAAIAAGVPERGVALVQDQLSQLPADHDPMVRARLLQSLADAAAITDTDVDALVVVSDALTLIPAEPDSELRCRALRTYAQALADRSRQDEAVRAAGEALAMAERIGLTEVSSDMAALLAEIQDELGDVDASRAALRQILADARQHGDAAELRALFHLAGSHYEQGQLDEAQELYLEGAARAAETGRRYAPYGIDARILAGLVAYARGSWEVALKIADTSGENPPTGLDGALATIEMQVAAGRGDPSALALMDRARRAWPTDVLVIMLSGGVAIELHGLTGDLGRTWRQHQESITEVGAHWTDSQALIRLHALMIGIAADLVRGEPEEQRRWTERADAILDEIRVIVAAAEKWRPLGVESAAWLARLHAERLRLDQRLGLPTDSTAHVDAWSRAVEAFSRFPHLPELTRTRIRLAAALRLAGRSEQSRELVEQARTVAERLGARPLLAELAALDPRPVDQSATALFTRREQEVLALISDGLSNRQIGERLFITAKTASVHVSNIMTKLGASSRTQAATLARRRGLIND
jgi:DNA-binding CsgD family transcriptional regulator